MIDLKSIVEEQQKEDVQSTRKYKILGLVCVLIVLYMAYCCVHLNFKVLTFLNDIADGLLSALNVLVLLVSDFLRELLMMI